MFFMDDYSMIDLEHENLLPIRDVPGHIRPRCSGRRVHVSTVYRWTCRGVCGITLESVKIGGSTYTSIEALQRFADALTTDNQRSTAHEHPALARQREIERATRAVGDVISPGQSERQ